MRCRQCGFDPCACGSEDYPPPIDGKRITGWLVMEDEVPHRPIEFQVEEDGADEAPYSNDNSVLQFHIEIIFPSDHSYPVAKIIE